MRRRDRIRAVTVASEVEAGLTPTDVVTALRFWLDDGWQRTGLPAEREETVQNWTRPAGLK